MKILIKNGRVIDPASGFDQITDIFIEDQKIKKIAPLQNVSADKIIDATGKNILPGLIDMHVHFREPGREDQETIIGGSKVAAKAGFTSVCTMPNTTPVIDNQALIRFIKMEAANGPINVFPIAAITKGSKGEEISEMDELKTAGAVAFSDDGHPVKSSVVMRRALEYSRMVDKPILAHEEDKSLVDDGIVNESANSLFLGLKGIPNEAEETMIARDVLLAKLTKGRLHICHMSTAGSACIIEMAKKHNIKVTCETAPHYFSLTDEVLADKMAMAKMNPPLRSEKDRQAIIEALKNDVIDVIATDHAPHLANEKMQELAYAPFGIVGLETAVPLIITKLIKENNFTWTQAFAKITCNPAKILDLPKGELKEGADADLTIIDPEKKIKITEDYFISSCKNSPFIGMELTGFTTCTICNGKIVYQN